MLKLQEGLVTRIGGESGTLVSGMGEEGRVGLDPLQGGGKAYLYFNFCKRIDLVLMQTY